MSLLIVWLIALVFGILCFFVARRALKDSGYMKAIGPWALLVYGMVATIGTILMGVILTAIFKPGEAKIGTITNAKDSREREALLVANYGGRLSPKTLEVFKIRANRSTMTWERLQELAEAYATGGWVMQDHAIDNVPIWYVSGMLNWSHAWQWSTMRAADLWYGETPETKDNPYKDRCYLQNFPNAMGEMIEAVKMGYVERNPYDTSKAQRQIDSKGYWNVHAPNYCYVPEHNFTWVNSQRETGKVLDPNAKDSSSSGSSGGGGGNWFTNLFS